MVARQSVRLPTLTAYERGEKSRKEMADELGVSVQWLRKLMARERLADRESGSDVNDDLPWVEIVEGTCPPTPHYDLATDRLEKPAGAFRIGNGRGRLRVQHAGDGRPVEAAPEKPPPKFRPKRPKRKKSHNGVEQ